MKKQTNRENILKSIGPGLLFASTAIGVTHFVLCTTAGAYYGLGFLGIIIAFLIFKYPFFEFSSRYAAATGKTLLHGYRELNPWVFYLYLFIQLSSMFTVTGAVAAVCGGLLGTILNLPDTNINLLAGSVLLFTFLILIRGKFKFLDGFIKVITIVLLLAVIITSISVIIKGMPPKLDNFVEPDIFDRAGMILLVGIIGWMPNGLEASIYNSIWIVEKQKSTGYKSTLKEVLFDFNLGYAITAVLAILFIIIGAMTIYGTGQKLDGSPVEFTSQLIGIFTTTLGSWSFYVIAITAFTAIYGTLISAWDVFARTWIFGMKMIRFGDVEENDEQTKYYNRYYILVLAMIGLFGFIIINWFGQSLGFLLGLATLISFLIAPLIGFLNLRVIQKSTLDLAFRPSKPLIWLAYIGLAAVTALAVYFISLQ